MQTIYFYTNDTKMIKKPGSSFPQEHYVVIKSKGDSVLSADNRAKAYAKSIGKTMAGGYFYASRKPYNFKTNYKVIEIPKGFRYKKKKGMDEVDMIIAYESGQLNSEDSLKLFSSLIKSGKIKGLQGSYGRTAQRLIEKGYLSKDGEILK